MRARCCCLTRRGAERAGAQQLHASRGEGAEPRHLHVAAAAGHPPCRRRRCRRGGERQRGGEAAAANGRRARLDGRQTQLLERNWVRCCRLLLLLGRGEGDGEGGQGGKGEGCGALQHRVVVGEGKVGDRLGGGVWGGGRKEGQGKRVGGGEVLAVGTERGLALP